MKHRLFVLIAAFYVFTAQAQESQEAYSFLRLPVSAHAAALGGDNISLCDDDATLTFHNPALLSNISDRSLNLNFMTYMEGAKTASAAFVKTYKERGTWSVAAQYMDYGSMKEVTADNVELGDFSARDVALSGSFAYLLGGKFSGGITARFVSSTIGNYSSAAVAVDLGLNYYDETKGWSFSAVAKNLGGQIKAYEDDFERIPLDLQLGATKRLIGSPLRLSVTLSRLNRWNISLLQHMAAGADLFLADNIYVAAGYNFLRAHEMKISDDEAESSHGAGLSLGGGIKLQRFQLNVAYAKYHVSASSLLVNVSYTL